jgi:LAS superfamily LD-carboxypeptidase LdcB
MAGFDWSQYAVGGATRPDTFTGMQPELQSALANMFTAAPPNIQSSLRVMSGYRSPERQTQLWNQALAKYGSPEAARKWVAPPGRSQHNHGNAADLKYLAPEALQWAHANAGKFGLAFPLKNENWHVELAGARGGGHHPGDGHNHGSPVAPTMANMKTGAFDPVGEVVAAAGAPQASALASLFANPTGMPAAGIPTAPGTLGGLALMFAQQQAERQKRREDEQEAEQTRRAALFSADSVAGLYG